MCDLDLNFRNPITNVRSYGSDKERVKRNTEIYVRTMQDCGMAACAKHFPGDGVDFRDHHLHPTYNSLTAEEWYDSYGEVYRNLIAHDLMSIMAGCDMIVFNTNFAEDYGYLLDGVREGLLTRERLDEAVERVLALKACVCGRKERAQEAETAESGIEALRWRRECADKAVTLVKNRNPQVLPVTGEKYGSIRLISLGRDKMAEGSIRETAGELLRKKGFEVECYAPYEDDLHGCKDLTKKRLTLYLANYEQASNQTEVRIHWCEKHALDIPRFLNEEDSIFVSFANPYHLQDVPRIKTYINAYTATRSTVEAVIEKLLGESRFEGISPVDAFCGLPDTRL